MNHMPASSLITRYLVRLRRCSSFLLERRSKIFVFETESGVKYELGGFDSDHFGDYAIGEVTFASTGYPWSALVMTPDLLRDRYTLCGRGLPQSPHFRLMEEIESGTLGPDSEYVSRCRTGTLDGRLPFEPNLDHLIQTCRYRKEELSDNTVFTISAIRVAPRGKPKYVIVNGKHRAALVAYLDRPESLHIQLLSNGFAQHPFFQRVYSRTLRLDPRDYSVNQQMIRAIQNES